MRSTHGRAVRDAQQPTSLACNSKSPRCASTQQNWAPHMLHPPSRQQQLQLQCVTCTVRANEGPCCGNSGSVSCRQVVVSAHATHARRTPHKQQQPPMQSADKHIAGKAALLSASASCMATCTVRQATDQSAHTRDCAHTHTAPTRHSLSHWHCAWLAAQYAALTHRAGAVKWTNTAAQPAGAHACASRHRGGCTTVARLAARMVQNAAQLRDMPSDAAHRPMSLGAARAACLHAGACLPLQTPPPRALLARLTLLLQLVTA